MKNALLALAIAIVLVLAPAHANSLAIQPVPDRAAERELVLERLVAAETQLQSWNVAAARTLLGRLVTDLAQDTTPFNKAVRAKAESIVQKLDVNDVRNAEASLTALIKAVRDGVMPAFADLGDTATI